MSPHSPVRSLVARARRRVSVPAVAAAAIAVLAGVAAFLLASTVFAYHSSNHDEAVYLMQAAMLLEGQLELHVGETAGAFRPWFFVEDGTRLYPKYTPVPAATYAVSMALFGEPRVTLAAVAAGNTALVYLLGRQIFDRPVGVVAAALFAASPLALVTSAVFLPYAPTTLLTLLFAVCYLRSLRTGSLPSACVAGAAIGLAFFARPLTAVLFAAPFVGYALLRVGRWVHARGAPSGPTRIRQHAVVGLVGLLFVGLTAAYNLHMTGSPLLFPYEAFAPLDGPGFGRREILDHSIVYTPGVAIRANAAVLWHFATRWFTAGAIGTALAVGGVGLAIHRWLGGATVLESAVDRSASFERTAGPLLAGVLVTVPVGNVFFWGNFNILGTPTDPTDGIISQFGPIYHFDLLVPLSVFAAVAIVWAWRSLGPLGATDDDGSSPLASAAGVAVVVTVVLLAGIVTAGAVSAPLERNAANTDTYERAYAPIDRASFDDALVFVPTPYGDWQHHPFQYLRNDPGLDGRVVYALDRSPTADFAVIDAYPDRTYYRYTYRGEWAPGTDSPLQPTLEPLSVRSGDRLVAETTVGVPDRVAHATVRLAANGRHATDTVTSPGDELTVQWSLDGEAARLEGAGDPVPLDGIDTVVVTVTLAQPDGSTLTYRQEAAVRPTGTGVEVVWPPERTVCPLVTDCGTEGTYLPDTSDVHREGVSFETEMRTGGGSP